uniref:Uncharacterized protein n=1 Tax=Ditylenchus dipsaci TaxID=166011 RepID=A0A915D796_9BILA
MMLTSGLDLLVRTIHQQAGDSANNSRKNSVLSNGGLSKGSEDQEEESMLMLDEEDEDDYLDEEEEEDDLDETPLVQTLKPKPDNNDQLATGILDGEMHAIKRNLLYLNHQMSQLMNALNVTSCACCNCKLVSQQQSKKSNVRVGHNNHHLHLSASANDHNNLESNSKRESSNIGKQCESVDKELVTERLTQLLQANANNNLQSFNPELQLNLKDECYYPVKRGRKSKYCSPLEKKAVAGYAQIHGATAAARKFNIPPAVAAYYHRKEYKSPKTLSAGLSLTNPPVQSNHHPLSLDANNPQAMDSSDDTKPEALLDGPAGAANPHYQSSDASNEADGNDLVWGGGGGANPAHSGSPGFLRGRGRGRPKLIGDELDAELVEYMVQIKQSNPRQHLTASQALTIARAYILDKSPTLLEERGGQIKLKITWAMKLVSRIAEREREIQLGLPSGSLQNLGRGNGPNNSSFMNELFSQNLFNQQNFSGGNNNSMEGGATQTPEILNVRELKLPSMSQTSGLSGESTGEVFDPSVLLADFGGNFEDFSNSEVFKSLIQNLRREVSNDNNELGGVPQLTAENILSVVAGAAAATSSEALLAQTTSAF